MTAEALRALLPLHAAQGLVGRTIHVKNEGFVIVERADAQTVERARALVRLGQTAGVMRETLTSPQAIFFDMDATVIAEESLVEIAKAAGKEAEVAALTTQAMAGGMEFAQSLRLRLAILKGTPRSAVLGIKPHLNPGIRALAEAMNARAVKLFLVSGGFMDLAEPVAKELGFLDVCANRFAWKGDVLAGDVEGEIVGADGKRSAVERWCKEHHLDPQQCIAVGDGANDQNMMSICGLAVGFEPKKALWDKISVCNATGDHRVLLEMLRTQELTQ